MSAVPKPFGVPARPVIPSPASLAGRRPVLSRRAALPPVLGGNRDPDAVYVLDSGVGLGFASIAEGMDLLQDHYGQQLCYVDQVMLEWTHQASWSGRRPGPGHTPEERQECLRRERVRAAAKVLQVEMPKRFGEPRTLGYEEAAEIDSLVEELQAFPPPAPGGGDRGECASVRYGEMLRLTGQSRVIVLCANDDRARRLAGNHGIAHRDMARVLAEMVRDSRITPEQAFEHYRVMCETTELPASRRPKGPADFA